jgi:hypothetical protein
MPLISRFDSIKTENGSEAPRLEYTSSLVLETASSRAWRKSARATCRITRLGRPKCGLRENVSRLSRSDISLYSVSWVGCAVALPSNKHIATSRSYATLKVCFSESPQTLWMQFTSHSTIVDAGSLLATRADQSLSSVHTVFWMATFESALSTAHGQCATGGNTHGASTPPRPGVLRISLYTSPLSLKLA